MNTPLPNSLASTGRGLPPIRPEFLAGSDSRSALLTSPPQIPNVPGEQPVLNTFIRPSARDRWMASNLHYYTAQVIENTARSAMAGNMIALWLMFDLMEQTWPRLSKNLNELKNAAVDLDWDIQAFAFKGKKPSAEALRRASAAEAALFDMSPNVTVNENDFDDTIRDVLDAVGKGISVLETDWQQKQYADVGALWRPRATRWVHPRYYGYPPYGAGQDELMLNANEVLASNPGLSYAQLVADLQLDLPSGTPQMWVPIPPNRYIISIIKQKTGHPLTGALLRILGFFWAAQNFTWEWFINLAQIFGQPFRWVTYDPTMKALLPLIEQMLACMGSQAWGAFPEGTQLKLEKAVENTKDNPQAVLIAMADEICDILILGQTLTTTQGSRGSQALGNIHKDVRDERIRAIARRAANTLNSQLLPSFCRLNFGDDRECPRLIVPAEEEDSAIERAQRDQIVLSSGAPVPKTWYYERHSIPVPEDGEETIAGNAGANPGATSEDDPPGQPKPKLGDGEEQGPLSTARARGLNSLETLTNRTLENLSGVQSRWLGSVKPVFRELIAAAKDGNMTDAQFVKALETAQKHFPELFHRLDRASLQSAMEKAMGAAAINGAVAGHISRRAA